MIKKIYFYTYIIFYLVVVSLPLTTSFTPTPLLNNSNYLKIWIYFVVIEVFFLVALYLSTSKRTVLDYNFWKASFFIAVLLKIFLIFSKIVLDVMEPLTRFWQLSLLFNIVLFLTSIINFVIVYLYLKSCKKIKRPFLDNFLNFFLYLIGLIITIEMLLQKIFWGLLFVYVLLYIIFRLLKKRGGLEKIIL